MRLAASTVLALLTLISPSGSIGYAQPRSSTLMPGVAGETPELILRGAASVIARLRLEGGGFVVFLDLGGGHVGVGERTGPRRRSVSLAAAVLWDATPLEIFLALAPDTAVPRVLRDNHDAYMTQSGHGAGPPRSFGTAVAALGLGEGGLGDFDCDGFGSNFYHGWLNTFENVTDHAHAAFAHHHSYPLYTFYPGGHIYYGTNTNQVTYLGACNGDFDTPFTLDIQRRIKYPTPPTTTTIWAEVTTETIMNDQKYTFYSNLPGSYRGQLKTTEPVDHMGWGVAYTKSPGLASLF